MRKKDKVKESYWYKIISAKKHKESEEMKKKKLITGAVAVVLSLVMSVQSVPSELLQAAADELKEILTQEETSESIEETDALKGKLSDKGNLGQGYIIEEDVSKRTLNTKEFVMSDDTIMVQQFGEAVHYLEDGEYKEIDNALVEEKTEAGETYYRNNANAFNVKIQNEPTSESDLVEIEEDGYSLKFGYKAKKEKKEKKVKTKAKGFEKKEKEFKYEDKKLKQPVEQISTTGEVVYENIEENTNITYQIQNNGVKENIIVSEAQEEYSYTFKIKTKGLTLIENEDGSIYANTETGETKFVIPAPFMVDAEGQYSDAVYYTLTEYNNKTELTITADERWINEEAIFPVTIDPMIESYTQTNYIYVNVSSNGEKTTSGAINVGKKTAGVKSDAFLRFEVEEMTAQYSLISANLNFTYGTRGMHTFNWKDILCGVSVVNGASSFSSITYSNKPTKLQELTGIDHTPQTLVKDNLPYNSSAINIQNIKNDALTVGIECLDGNSDGGYIVIQSASVLLTYRNVSGTTSSESIETFAIEGAMAYVNNGTGYLGATSELASVNTLSDITLSSSLVYNSYYNLVAEDFGISPAFGDHVKLNYEQYIRGSADRLYYQWIGADGSITTFYEDFVNGLEGYYQAKSKNLYLHVERVGTPERGIISDTQGNELWFENGRLTKIVNNNAATDYIEIRYGEADYGAGADNISTIRYYENKAEKARIEIYYTSGKATTVRTRLENYQLDDYTLSYDDNDNLTSVKHIGENLTVLTYEYTNLATGELGEISNYAQEGLTFTRETNGDKIVKVQQVTGSSENTRYYGYAEFTYSGRKNTTVEYYENEKLLGEKHVAFNNYLTPISEWTIDALGEINVSNRGNWEDRETQVYTNDYVQETFTYTDEQNTSVKDEKTLNAGDCLTINVSANKENSSFYQYALSFKMQGEPSANVRVTLGDTTDNIQLDSGAETYASVSCGYVNSGTATIENTGSCQVTISNIYYGEVDYTQTLSGYDSANISYGLETAISYTSFGEYSRATYNEKSLVTELQTKDALNPSVVETTTYTYTNEGKISTAITKNASNEEISRKEYVYEENTAGTQTTTTAISTESGIKTRTVNIVDKASLPYKVTQINANGEEMVGTYDIAYDDLRLIQFEYGKTLERYTYNSFGQISNVIVYDKTTAALVYSQTNEYENGVYTGSTYAGDTYGYTYDGSGLVTEIKENGTTMLAYTYNAPNGYNDTNALTKKTYANGQVEEYTYGTNKYTVSHKTSAGGTVNGAYEYNYNSKGEITSQRYKAGGSTQVSYSYQTRYDTETLTINGMHYGTNYKQTQDEDYDRVKSVTLNFLASCFDMHNYTGEYTYDNEGRLKSSSLGSYTTTLGYDKLGRVSTYQVEYANTVRQNKTYGYATYTVNDVTYATNRLVSITDSIANEIDSTSTYDANGNISGITYGDNTSTYTYDGLGRLTSETNNGTRKAYGYDLNNNILAEGLTYDENGKLTAVNGAQIDYDEMGNPTTYKGNTFVWEQGRKLASGTMNGKSFSYRYDGNGMRYKKVVNGATTEYYLNGSQILAEYRNDSKMIVYLYDASGVVGMIYDEEYYFYDKNTLGDIVAIRDESGDIVARYVYDAWGNHTVQNEYGGIDYSTTSIGHINPFRYRGYYYDTETGFYYLQTRYYDPTICRFINADNYELVAELASSMQLNMYAYCGNNPVMYTDETGTFFLTALFTSIITGMLVGGGVAGGIAYLSGARGNELIASIVGGAIMGGAMGAVLTIGGAAGLTYAGMSVSGYALSSTTAVACSLGIGAGAGMLKYSAETWIRGDEWNWKQFGLAGISGMIQGGATFFVGYLGGQYGAFDQMYLRQFYGGKLIKNYGAYAYSKGVMANLASNVGRNFITGVSLHMGEGIAKMIFSAGAAGARWLIAQSFLR